MRQAVVLLTIVAIALLAVSCCIVTGSVEQSQQLERKQQQLLEAKRALGDLQSEHDQLALENEGLTAKLDQLNEQLGGFALNRDALQSALEEALTSAQLREDELTRQALSQSDAQADWELRVVALQGELDRQKESCTSLGNELLLMTREHDALQAALTTATDDLAAALSEKHAALDASAAALESRQSELDAALSTEAELRGALESMQTQIDALTAEIAEKRAECLAYMKAVTLLRAYQAGSASIADARAAIADFHAAYPQSVLTFGVEKP